MHPVLDRERQPRFGVRPPPLGRDTPPDSMSEQTQLTRLATNVVAASALLRHLGVDPAGPEGFLTGLSDDFANYFELSVPHSFDRLGLMTRGTDEAFTGRVAEWLGQCAGAGAALRFRESAERFGHGHSFVKAVFSADKAPLPTYYFRRRLQGPEALELLAAEGVADRDLAILRAIADDLGKQTLAIVARRVVPGGADRLKAYFTQYLPDGAPAILERLGAVATRLGVREDMHRAIRGSVRALADGGGATLFVGVELQPAVLPELKLYFESVAPAGALATCDAMRILGDLEERTSLPSLLGVLQGLFGAESVDYLGLRFGPDPIEMAFYHYRSSEDA